VRPSINPVHGCYTDIDYNVSATAENFLVIFLLGVAWLAARTPAQLGLHLVDACPLDPVISRGNAFPCTKQIVSAVGSYHSPFAGCAGPPQHQSLFDPLWAAQLERGPCVKIDSTLAFSQDSGQLS
jgi:hypothetical protein